MIPQGYESAGGVEDVIAFARRKGVRLWVENRQLRYKAPRGALTSLDIEHLRESRERIVSFLERAHSAPGVSEREPDRRLDRAPLTFSQLVHWHACRLHERHGIRQVASAMRLTGSLDIEHLRESIAIVVRRHDALRMRFVMVDGEPMQELAGPEGCELSIEDLSGHAPAHRETQVLQRIDALILEPVNIATGPLFGARLLTLGPEEHVLLLAMEHIISDGASLSIFVRELFSVYEQVSCARQPALPEVAVQLGDYARWQASIHASRLDQHGARWREWQRGYARLRFPEGRAGLVGEGGGWDTVPVRIDAHRTAQLRDWCRARRTTLAMGVFAAYVALVLRWCNVSKGVFQYQSDGRIDARIENTIGYFAAMLYPHVELKKDDTFFDLMDRVTEAYCTAYEHADYSYLAAQVPPPEFTRNTAFNWLPQRSRNSAPETGAGVGGLDVSQISFSHPMVRTLEVDSEPSVMLAETEEGIVGDLYFPRSRFPAANMDRFVRNLVRVIDALSTQPGQRVHEVALEPAVPDASAGAQGRE